MFADEDLIPISALQHHLFCPRQCALIHVDGLWAENRLTAEGRVLHERSDSPGHETRAASSPPRSHAAPTAPHSQRATATRTVRALPLLCRRLGITGKADQVELPINAAGAIAGPPRPIEHKRGKPKRLHHDRVQLAAQALCLEEMFGTTVLEGELFYHTVRRRERVPIDAALRARVETTIAEVRDTLTRNHVPKARKQPKCKNCSLANLCLPQGTGPDRNPALYLSRSLAISLRTEDAPPPTHEDNNQPEPDA